MISRSQSFLLASLPIMLAALPAVAQDAGLVANQEIRIQQLESEIRGLTGQVEDLSYQVRMLTQKMDKLVGDTDFRLRQLEGTPGGAAETALAGEPTQSAPTQSAESFGAPAALPAPPPAPPVSAVGKPRILGTMSESDLEAQRARLNAADPAAAAAAAAGQGGQMAATTQPPAASPDELYQHAFSLLRQTKYAEAEKALKSFIAQYPDHPLTGNANYWLGESYYVRADYNNAALTFAEGFQKYPRSRKAPDNLLKLGMSLAALGEQADACKAFAELEARYPNANDNVKQRAARERQKDGC